MISADEGKDAAAGRRGLEQAYHGVVGIGAGVAEPDPPLAVVRKCASRSSASATAWPTAQEARLTAPMSLAALLTASATAGWL